MSDDPTFQSIALTGSQSWVAARIGRSYDWFCRAKEQLYAAGFPQPDPLLKQWIKADVEAWLEKRRKIPDHQRIEVSQEVKFDAL